ncbi:Outer membrane protein assembly factor BamA [Nymphon striatum]|nr:Outer membrane protein assembly factor BamA [Nymphon striatum]
MKNQILRASVAGCLLALSQGVWAGNFILKDVQVSGLERVAAGTVLSNLPVRVGQNFDDRMTADVVRSLYKTGLFEDVKISRRGDALLIKVQERAPVGEIKITGNKAIDTKALLAALKQAGVAKGRPLDKSSLVRIEQGLKQQYLSRGNYAAEIKTSVDKISNNRVGVNIKINEGQVARIKRVKISGNKAFSDKALMKLLESGVPGPFSFFSSKDKYSKQKLVGDIDKLSSFYRDRGYLNFEVVSSQVSLSKDKSEVYVNLNIHEGDQYRVGKIIVAPSAGVSEAELRKQVTMREGQLFSQASLAKTRKNLKERLGKKGYAFSRVGIVPKVDKVNKRVHLTFQTDQGQRTYVRRINIRGNYRTKDEVFRREMRQLESAFYSKERVDRSKVRIQRLPYVESVAITTSPVAGRSDQVDIDVTVKERSSNQFSAGLGYSQSNGVLFNVGLSQNNFMGTGKSLSIAAANSEVSQNFRVSYNNPYHTVDGVGRGFNVFYNKTDAAEDDVSDYTSDSYGANINYTIPMTEHNSLRFSIGGEHREISTTTTTPLHIKEFIDKNGDSYDNILGTVSYIHDTRNRSLFPNEGQRQSIALEVGIPGSDLEYYKLKYKGSTYHKVTEDLTFSVRGGISYGDGISGEHELPFFENFYSGGIKTVRGFESNSLGPKDSNGDSRGGAFSTNATAELSFSVPFVDDVKGLRMSAFVDGGNVFADVDDFDADELRYSAGVGITWISPLGPLTASVAKPLNSKDGDEEQEFQFSIGANPTPPVESRPSVSVGVVNVTYIMENAPQAEVASNMLKSKFLPQEKVLAEGLEVIQKLEAELDRSVKNLSVSQKRQKERELRAKKRARTRSLQDFREELRFARDSALDDVQKEVFKAIDDVRKLRGIDIVVQDYISASKRVDITSLVLTHLNEKLEKALEPKSEDNNLQLEGVSTLQDAKLGQISFVSNPKYKSSLKDTQASAVILSPSLAENYSGNALINKDPYLTFAKVVTEFNKQDPLEATIHESVVVGSSVQIGDKVCIGPNVVIEDGVAIGDGVVIGAGCSIGAQCEIKEGSLIYPNVTIYKETLVGRNCIFHSGAVIGADGFGFAPILEAEPDLEKGSWYKIPQVGNVIIGDDVEIGANTTIDRAALGSTIIGDGVKLDNQIQIGHNVHLDKHVIIAGGAGLAGSSYIGKRCQIGGGVGIAGHLEITDDVVLTGKSMVIRSIKKAGVYSSGIPADDNRKWRRNATRFRNLDDMAKQIKQLQLQLKELEQKK